MPAGAYAAATAVMSSSTRNPAALAMLKVRQAVEPEETAAPAALMSLAGIGVDQHERGNGLTRQCRADRGNSGDAVTGQRHTKTF